MINPNVYKCFKLTLAFITVLTCITSGESINVCLDNASNEKNIGNVNNLLNNPPHPFRLTDP